MPEDRTSLIKPFTDLKDLPSSSKDIEMDNALKRYKRRPRTLYHLSYADFVSWYDMFTETKRDKPGVLNAENELPEVEYNSDKDEDVLLP
ncbi:hypothetical protein DPMN_095721 [Dreissena polymorpha]|uniref:Uncharacterized protein n=1 Tax=Dreissena polymorpha TaxID=45954 RepID=A0A9D4R352_DREPO|nr:hypothetical protein DPMN_095721 [Dreissena polymorpha]